MAMLQDIGKEYAYDFAQIQKMGKENSIPAGTQGEWTILYINHILHFAFHILIFLLIIFTFRLLHKKYKPEKVIKDEVIFITAQYIGMFCGLIGLAINILVLIIFPVRFIQKFSIVFSFIIIIPYGIIVSYWLAIKSKEKIKEWYDEKQFNDITRASLITIIILVPVMAIIFFIYHLNPVSAIIFIWFPVYLFLTLLIFSAGTLYFSQRA